ncbi:MAG TPA: ATP-binding protein [Pantanalinema sp.]
MVLPPRRPLSPQDWPLQRTLVVLFLLIVTLSLLPLSLLHAHNTRSVLEQNTRERMLVAARDTGTEIEAYLARLLEHARFLASDQPRMRAFLLGIGRPGASAELWADKPAVTGIRKLRGYLSIAALSPEGRVIWQDGEDVRPWLPALAPDIREARAGKAVPSDILSDGRGRAVAIAVVAPVRRTPADRPSALLVLVDSLGPLRRIVAHDRSSIGPSSYGVLLDQDRKRLIHGADPALEGLEAPWFPADFELTRDRPLMPRFFRAYLTFERGPGCGMVVFLRSKPWSYSVLVPESYYLAPIWRALRQDAMLFLGLLVALAALAYLLGRWYLRPIADLKATALAWQHGQFGARAVPAGRNEIGALGETFNQMADQIQGYTRDLECMVGARTRELMQLNEVLRERERKLVQAQHIAQLGSWEWDLTQDRITWSEEYYRITGKDPARWSPTMDNFLASIHPEDRPRVEQAIQAAIRGEAGYDVEFRLAEAGDGIRTMHAQGEILCDEAGKPLRMYGFIQDVTEHKRLEDELRRRYEGLKELDRLKNSFINALTHELRTPLTAVLGFAELLEDELGGPLLPDQRDFVHEIQRGARRLESLLNDLLDFVRIEAGTFHLNLCEADFTAKVREAIDDLEHQATEADVTLQGPAPDAPVTLCMDARRIKQVLSNLLSNAIKFSPRQGVVTVRILRENGRLRCEIQDQGEGIAPEKQALLFRRFVQLENGVRKGKGAGLGLSISKALVEAHGGEIGVLSAPGQGSTFWFSLPLERGGQVLSPGTSGPGPRP